MRKKMFSSHGKFLIFVILIVLVSVFVVAGVQNVNVSYEPTEQSTQTHVPFAGVVELAKPTYTFTPVVLPTETLVPVTDVEILPSASASALVQVEIVPDTPIPAYENVVTEGEIISQPSYSGNKYILVDISEQHMYVYEGDVMIYSFVASTGINNGTRVGSFSVLDKIPNAYGATWDLWMPNWLGIYWSGSLENGIHALPILSNGVQLWAGYLGTPISYGCVVLGVYESQLLYDWAEVGTPVDIQW